MSDPVSGATVAAGGLMNASMFGLASDIARKCGLSFAHCQWICC